MLDFILSTLKQLDFEYSEQFLVALLPMSLTDVLHGQGMGLVVRYLRHFGKHVRHGSRASLRTLGLVSG